VSPPVGGRERSGVALDKLTFGAFLGIASLAVIQFLQLRTLDAALTVSLYCFAVAIPVLAMGMFIIAVQELYEVTIYPVWADWVETLGVALAFVGLGGIFWHFHCQAAIVFGAVSVLVGTLTLLYVQRLTRTNSDE
jgi:hypothetical protein